jgi:hypothetical protein
MRCKPFRGKVSVTFSVFIILALAILGATQVYAQVAGARLTGTVKDSSGAIIPNAQVAITDMATSVTRNVSSGGAGLYTAPNLLPGNYEIRVTATGFGTLVQKGITLTVGAEQVLDIIMQVGQLSQTIEVTSEAPTVELTSSAISDVVNSSTVRELPLNGRSWTDLATLQPGVVSAETHRVDVSRGFGSQVSISGARPQQSNYRLDGVSLNDYANGGPGSLLGGNLGVDAIQEFSVLTSNYSAEYGKSSGGVVNAISRSGANQFHGSAYEFLRNSALDARNFFDGPTIPPFKRNQFGASAGGPIRKDRTFIFGDYEGIRQSEGITSVDTVPSVAARAGQLCSVPGTPPVCTPTTVTVDPEIQKALGLYSLPNGALRPGGNLGVFSFASQQIVTENFFTVRLDHKISDKDSVFGAYQFDFTPLTQPDAFNDVLLGSRTNGQFAVLEENHIFSPTLVNSVRFGYNRDRADDSTGVKAINPVAADPLLGAVPGYDAPTLSIPGMTKFRGGVKATGGTVYRWNAFQIYDDASLTRRRHSVKIGVAFERDQNNTLTIPTAGQVSFGSLSDFLTNNPSKFLAFFPNLETERGNRQSIIGAYVQDDWRWRSNLTLNLGVRYEMSTVPTEIHGEISNLYNITDAQPHCLKFVTGCIATGPYFHNPTLRNFDPRVGFSWDPFRNGKTAVRGGFGMYDSLPLLYEFITLNGRQAPFFENGSVTSGLQAGSFPSGLFGLLNPLKQFEQQYVEPNPKRNYVMQWNLNVQRELTPSVAMLIGYVGSRGVHQPFRADDANIVMPTLSAAGYLWPSPVHSGTVINPNVGAIRFLDWGGDSFFDALEFGVTKKMSHGVQFQGSYTWGKSIDTNSGVLAGDTFLNSITSLPWYNLKLGRGLSDFNIGRTVVINVIWQVPQRKSLSGPAGWVVNGWVLAAIYKANDGVPFTATFGTGGDPLGLNSTDPVTVPNRLTGSGCSSLVNPGNPNNYIKTQCFAVPTAPSTAFYTANCDPKFGTSPQCFNLRGNAGRNILTGPGLTNLDFSLFKNNPIKRISESFNAQFRVEVFNILNHANFSQPVTPDNTDIFDASGLPTGAAGLLTSTATTAREIQFALKMIW